MAKVVLAHAANVLVPAHLALLQKGFLLRYREAELPGAEELWYATKDDLVFSDEDPILLLGLITLYETRGENWQASDEEIDEYLCRYQ